MMIRDLESPMPADEAAARWEGPDGQILVEVKKTNSVRDVREGGLIRSVDLGPRGKI